MCALLVLSPRRRGERHALRAHEVHLLLHESYERLGRARGHFLGEFSEPHLRRIALGKRRVRSMPTLACKDHLGPERAAAHLTRLALGLSLTL